MIGKKYFNKYTDYQSFDWKTIVQWVVVIGAAVGLYILAINLRGIENQTWFIKESISLLNNISNHLGVVGTREPSPSYASIANKIAINLS